MSELPQRPRLANFALARRHTARGETFVAVLDSRDGSVLRLDEREWTIVACADGTRDLDGIMLAAARRGAYRRASEVRALLGALHASGLLEGGTDSPVAAAALLPPVPDDRALDPLAGYAFACDGSGGCCGHYASIELLPEDALRARVHVPTVDGAFTPLRGSRDDGSVAAPLVDGRCAYLAPNGRCAIHAAAGAAAKPLACLAYPRTYVDDGEAVRVSIGVECACALASLDVDVGEPLATPGQSVRGALPRGTKVRALPALVAITDGTAARREAVAAWSRARSEGDPARRARHRVAEGAERWLAAGAWAPPAWPQEEALYARATLHGHHCAGVAPLAPALRDRAARLLVARAMERRFADVEHVLRA